VPPPPWLHAAGGLHLRQGDRPRLAPYGSSADSCGPTAPGSGASLARPFRLRERSQLQFRWQVFNVFNRPNFANPSGGSSTNDVSSPLVG
jgi:hypothetical protein